MMHIPSSRPAAAVLSALLPVLLWSNPGTATMGDPLAEVESQWQQGNLRRATILLKDELKRDPNAAGARVLAARIELDRGNPIGAIEELERAIKAGTPREEVLVPLGQILLDQGQHSRLLDEIRVGDAADARDQALLLAMRGEAYLALEDSRAAEVQFRGALRKAPSLARAQAGLARLAYLDGKASDARRLIAQAIESEPDSVEAWDLLAVMELAEGHYAEAAEAYTKALEHSRRKWLYHVRRALARIPMGDLEGAEADILASEKAHQGYAGVLFARGLLAFSRGDSEGAYRHFEDFLEYVPQDVNGLYYAAITSFNLKNYEMAQHYLTRHRELEPGSAEGARLLGMTYVATGELARAEELLRPFAQPKDADPALLQVYANALAGQRRFEEATEVIARLHALDPDDPKLNLLLAEYRLKAGDPAAADRILERLLRARPDDQQALLLRFKLRLATDDAAGAMEIANELARLAPDSQVAHNTLGTAHLAAGDLQAARAAFAKSQELGPEFESASYLAMISLAEGKLDQAKVSLEDLLAEKPGHTQAHVALARLQRLQGSGETAIPRLESALDGDPSNLAIRIELAMAYGRADQVQKALALLKDAPPDQADHPGLLSALGKLELAAKQPYSAVESFQRLVRLRPRDATARYQLATALAVARNVTGMQETLREAVAMDAEHRQLPTTLELVSKAMPDAASRQRLLQELKEIAPDNRHIAAALGTVALALRDYGQALAIFEPLTRSQPDDAGLVVKLALAQRGQGDLAGSQATLLGHLAKQPDDVSARRLLAQVYNEIGDQAAAREQYGMVIEARPDDAVALNNLAQLLAESDPAQALAYAEQASRLLPGNPVVADTLGMLLFKGGDRERARQLLQAAHEGLPNDASVAFRYASVLAEIGDEEQARTLLAGIAQTGFPEQDEAKALLERLTK